MRRWVENFICQNIIVYDQQAYDKPMATQANERTDLTRLTFAAIAANE